MTTAQLRLLGILSVELVSDAVQKLDIALVGILLEGIDKRVRQSARRLTADSRIGRRLLILAARPHDDVGRRRLRPQVLLVHIVSSRHLLEESGCAGDHTTNILASI